MTTRIEPLSAEEISNPPSRGELRQTFDHMTNSQYMGVSGALRIDASNGQKGPVIGITALTHGNEPSGLAPIFHYLREDRLRKLLTRGSVVFTVNNIQAASAYFAAHSDAERLHLRFVDVNMNRLQDDILDLQDDRRYEIRRTLELLPILKEFDAGLDIHSSYTAMKPMIIAAKGGNEVLSGFPIQTVITNMLAVQRGIPISALYGGMENRNIPVVGIEAGTHEGPEAPVNATIASQAFLQYLGLIPGKPATDLPVKDAYRISRPVLFPDDSYGFVKKFASFEFVEAGQVLATGNGPEVTAPHHGHILFPKPNGFNPQLDEAAFIADPPTTID